MDVLFDVLMEQQWLGDLTELITRLDLFCIFFHLEQAVNSKMCLFECECAQTSLTGEDVHIITFMRLDCVYRCCLVIIKRL